MHPLCEFQEEDASASHKHERGTRTHTTTADFLIFTPLFPFVRNLATSSMLHGFIGCLSLDKRQSSGIWSFISLIKAFHKQFLCILKSNKCPLKQHYATTTGLHLMRVHTVGSESERLTGEPICCKKMQFLSQAYFALVVEQARRVKLLCVLSL